MKHLTRILLIGGILLLLNLLSKQYFFRWDVTQDKNYTLSKATKDILRNLDVPVTISAYFSEDLPQVLSKAKTDFRDILVEYATRSKGMVNYEFVDPSGSPEKVQEAMANGIGPVSVNVREKDELSLKEVYLGASIKAGEMQEVIPLIQPNAPLEYQLTTAIKKLTVADKPSVGIVQGHGEPDFNELSGLVQTLSILYSVEAVDLSATAEIPARFRAVLLIRPTDTLPPAHLQALDQYLAGGGHMCVAINAVDGNFQNAQGTPVSSGVAEWLGQRGLNVESRFVIDMECGSVTVQQRQMNFTFNSQVQFPYFPRVASFIEHPITKGLEQVFFQFASPIQFVGDSTTQFIPIVQSSANSGILNAPLVFDIQKQWARSDFPMSNVTIGGILEDQQANGAVSKIVVFSDGDFPMMVQGRGQSPDNISLMANAVDWLSDDTGLIDLRTKGSASRPIKDMEDGKRSWIKWLNFGLPIVLVIVYGIFRFQRNRQRRSRRKSERYS